MQLETYDLINGSEVTQFEFWSESPKGKILKIIKFQSTDLPNLYNLAFGDHNKETGDIDDRSVSNNGDSKKVLATVLSSVFAFTNMLPNAWIYATGSTSARTRLYQMGINKYFDEAVFSFEIMGETDDNNWEIYQKGKVYQAIVVRRKTLKFE